MLIFFQVLVLLFSSTQESIKAVDVVHSLPSNDQGIWVIGEHEIKQTSSTTFGSGLAVTGNLAEVMFVSTEEGKIAQEINPLAIVASEVKDGPYIFREINGEYVAITYENNKVVRKTLPVVDGLIEFNTDFQEVKTIHINPSPPKISETLFTQPEKLLAISDLEGNLDHLIAFLKKHGVIDENFDWSWGSNHLLFNGDSVDRGDRVTELLWFVRKLQQQASKQGGMVHFVIGNHETMILCDDIRYVHPKYHYVTEKLNMPYHSLFNMKSVLGHWMRAQNAIVQIGPYLFVHAGYSPNLLALNKSHEEVNSAIRKSLRPPAWGNREHLETSLAWHRQGPLWFRGYFTKHLDTYGPKPTSDEIDQILQQHQAEAIIVGHTVVDHVGYLDGDPRLICVDVKWSVPQKGEGLLIQYKELKRLTMDSETPLELETNPTSH